MLSHPTGLGDYTHTPLIGKHRTIFHLPTVFTKPVDRKLFKPIDNIPVPCTRPLGGNQTHDMRLTISDPDYWPVESYKISSKLTVRKLNKA